MYRILGPQQAQGGVAPPSPLSPERVRQLLVSVRVQPDAAESPEDFASLSVEAVKTVIRNEGKHRFRAGIVEWVQSSRSSKPNQSYTIDNPIRFGRGATTLHI